MTLKKHFLGGNASVYISYFAFAYFVFLVLHTFVSIFVWCLLDFIFSKRCVGWVIFVHVDKSWSVFSCAFIICHVPMEILYKSISFRAPGCNTGPIRPARGQQKPIRPLCAHRECAHDPLGGHAMAWRPHSPFWEPCSHHAAIRAKCPISRHLAPWPLFLILLFKAFSPLWSFLPSLRKPLFCAIIS